MIFSVPICIDVKPDTSPISIEKELNLKRYTDLEVLKLWGFTAIHKSRGKVIGFTAVKAPAIPISNEYLFYLLQYNYYLELNALSDKSVVNFSNALQLYKKGKAGYLIAIRFDSRKIRLRKINPYIGHPYLITQNDLSEIINIYKLIRDSKSKNKNVLIDRFATASSVSNQGISGFVDLVSIIESLLVPDGKLGEINYKLRIRSMVIGCPGYTSNEIWQYLKKSYNVRSEWLHQSKNSLEGEVINFVNKFVRICIIEYLKDDKVFSSDNIDKLIIDKLK